MVKTNNNMLRRRLRDLSIIQNPLNSEETNIEQQTAIRSSNVPNITDEPTEIQTRNANLLPINYKSWHHMPNSNKNQALDNIKERFTLEVLDNYVKKALGKKWKDHKSTLKKEYFKKNISLEKKLQNVPPRMLMYQWEDAVRFWNSKKGEDHELVETTSRQKQKFTHTTGSKSFACVADDKELSSGQKVGHLQLFDIPHKKKDGSPMTIEVAEIMEKLKDKMAEYEAIASSNSSVNLVDIDNRIITEVLGPKSSQQYIPSVNQAQAKVQRLEDQMAQMQASIVEQIAQLKAKEASREAKAQRKYDELQLQLKAKAVAREAEARKYDELQLQL
ncbi:hypothetical protein GOBAR_AA15290 [Gossypium barbadense]|uniref:Transposase Tnp1/En/Spm-like domain-containing protein n=1 Tax=Gossypium barbadense TaxID=3634 RepID=A0A2P5XPX3_GOSBA|nr:hypothetical protein GOBAR_AA15290 [Gossypium barbadense]